MKQYYLNHLLVTEMSWQEYKAKKYGTDKKRQPYIDKEFASKRAADNIDKRS